MNQPTRCQQLAFWILKFPIVPSVLRKFYFFLSRTFQYNLGIKQNQRMPDGEQLKLSNSANWFLNLRSDLAQLVFFSVF